MGIYLYSVAVLALLVQVANLGSKSFACADTLPSEVDKLNQLKARLETRGPHWRDALSGWTCPTPSGTSNGACDPCGKDMWWGNWAYIGCRGSVPKSQDILGGDGHVTNIHFTNFGPEGPTLPIDDLCELGFNRTKEMDITQGDLAKTSNPITGAISPKIATCFPILDAIKFSFNELTGTIPAFLGDIKTLEALKLRDNNFVGSIPMSLGTLPVFRIADLGYNNLTGNFPVGWRNHPTLAYVEIDMNDMEGDLYNLRGVPLQVTRTANNPRLCGMIPEGVKSSHGFNTRNTGLGKPCPGATYPPKFDSA